VRFAGQATDRIVQYCCSTKSSSSLRAIRNRNQVSARAAIADNSSTSPGGGVSAVRTSHK
jgi:hypothetical protein